MKFPTRELASPTRVTRLNCAFLRSCSLSLSSIRLQSHRHCGFHFCLASLLHLHFAISQGAQSFPSSPYQHITGSSEALKGLKSIHNHEFPWYHYRRRRPWQVQSLQIRFSLAEGGSSVPSRKDCSVLEGWKVRRACGSWCTRLPRCSA